MVQIPILLRLFTVTQNAKRYKLGAKPKLNSHWGDWYESDCSGYVRWLLYHASLRKLKLPAGSVLQHDYIKQLKWEPCNYIKSAGKRDNILRIAFLRPRTGKPGHVWLILNGKTIECFAGVGVGQRNWNAAPLRNASGCYIVPISSYNGDGNG